MILKLYRMIRVEEPTADIWEMSTSGQLISYDVFLGNSSHHL